MNYFPKDNIEFRSCWYWIIPCMKYGSLTMDYLDKKMTINMCSSGIIYIVKKNILILCNHFFINYNIYLYIYTFFLQYK